MLSCNYETWRISLGSVIARSSRVVLSDGIRRCCLPLDGQKKNIMKRENAMGKEGEVMDGKCVHLLLEPRVLIHITSSKSDLCRSVKPLYETGVAISPSGSEWRFLGSLPHSDRQCIQPVCRQWPRGREGCMGRHGKLLITLPNSL